VYKVEAAPSKKGAALLFNYNTDSYARIMSDSELIACRIRAAGPKHQVRGITGRKARAHGSLAPNTILGANRC
jgi:hypothetical protein